jgi:hypothetical protein
VASANWGPLTDWLDGADVSLSMAFHLIGTAIFESIIIRRHETSQSSTRTTYSTIGVLYIFVTKIGKFGRKQNRLRIHLKMNIYKKRSKARILPITF